MKQISKKIKILLIDDDEMMRILFRDVFWIHGRSDTYDVSMASSFKEAEKAIVDGMIPDSIFMGMMMPVKGEENSAVGQIERTQAFIEKIKKSEKLSHIKIIIYTSHKEKSIKDEALKLGVDGYLIKGEIMPKEIISFVDKLYELHN